MRRPLVLALGLGAPLAVASLALFDEDIDRLMALAAACALATAYLGVYWPLASRLGLLPAAMELSRLHLVPPAPDR